MQQNRFFNFKSKKPKMFSYCEFLTSGGLIRYGYWLGDKAIVPNYGGRIHPQRNFCLWRYIEDHNDDEG